MGITMDYKHRMNLPLFIGLVETYSGIVAALQVRTLRVLSLVAILGLLSGCQNQSGNQNPLIGAFIDSDTDGWYDENRNQLIHLFIERIENHTGSRFNDRPTIAIDDRIMATMGQTLQTDTPCASRAIGSWGMPERTDTLQADLRITSGDIHSSARKTFFFQSINSTFVVSHNDYVVHFRTVRTLFSDASPDRGNADADRDGVSDTNETAICSPSRSAGIPVEKDLLVVVGFTHPDWALSQKSRDLLTTTFFNKKRINLNIYTENDPVRNITPGQVKIGGNTPDRSHKITLEEGREMRSQLVPDKITIVFHVLVLAEELSNGHWGQGEIDTAANDFVCRSHLGVLGPDFLEYQAKDVMHELGHNLGLCHPPESTNGCPSGAIPVAERNSGFSVMGTPMDSAGPIEVMTEALSRPLDYTPGQWQNINLTRVLGSN